MVKTKGLGYKSRWVLGLGFSSRKIHVCGLLGNIGGIYTVYFIYY
jgi:hypothetical protein